MDSQQLQLLHRYETTYWWHISRRAILQSVLVRHAELAKYSLLRHSGEADGHRLTPESYNIYDSGQARMTEEKKTRILDVGCGTGGNFVWLQKFGEVNGVDTSEKAVELASQQGKTILGRAEDLPVEDREFDLVTAFDVLEHLSDEKRALGEWRRVLRSGGLLFISVPSYQWLFGPHDRALEHYRRYNQPGLIKLLENNGFQPLFSSYIFCLTFPLFLVQRWLAKFSRQNAEQYVAVPPVINNLLICIGKLEACWLRFSQLPFGSSIVVVTRKS